jgi:Holliday junction resolvasome RuvABC endonuclease subunit
VILIGIDPGPEKCGFVVYDGAAGKVQVALNGIPVEETLKAIERYCLKAEVVAIERVQSYGIAGSSLLRTSEVVGRLWQHTEKFSVPVRLVYRREVLRALDVTGRGSRDALVRQRIIEIHGGTRQTAVGTKKAPGPCYGVSGHAWAALAVALAHVSSAGSSG